MVHNVPLLRPGQLLERRYRLGPLLARGGFGEVYEAADEQLGRPVALKYIYQPLDPAQLHNEVNILAAHAERLLFMPNVYSYWQGARGVGFFIVMEFVEGPTLKESRPLPWPADKVITFLRTLLGNLNDLHRYQIIHCDIKPVNIKATPDYQLSITVPYRLLDFGIARQVGETVISGASPHYSAPEQHGLGTSKIDHGVDLYALGATAYFLLTGYKPADSRNRYAAISRGDPDELRPPASLAADVPPGLAATVLDLLQLDRQRRPADTAAALALLEQRLVPTVVDGGAELRRQSTQTVPADAKSASGATPPMPPTAHPAQAIGTISLPVRQAGRNTTGQPALNADAGLRTPPAPAATPQAEPQAAALLDRYGNGVISGLAWDADGAALLIATSLGIYRYDVADTSLQLWQATTAAVTQFGITQQGNAAVFCSVNQLQLLPLDGAIPPASSAISLYDERVLSAPWSSTLALIGADTLRLVDLNDQTDELVLNVPSQIAGRVVALAADGQVVAFGVAGEVTYFSLRGQHQQLTDLPQPLADMALSLNGSVLALTGPDALVVWQADDALAQVFAHPGASRLALSSDGELLAVTDDSGVSLRLSYDGRTLPELEAADLPSVCWLSFCPRDQLLVAATAAELRIWRLADRSLVARLTDFGPNGVWLAPQSTTGFVSAGPELRVWALEADRLALQQSLAIEQPAGGVAATDAVLASAEGNQVVLRTQKDLAVAGRRVVLPAQHHGLALSPDGSRLVVAGAAAIVVSPVDAVGAEYQLALDAADAAEHVVFASDAGRFAVHSRGLVVVHALADGSELCTVRPRTPAAITALALSPDGTQLAAALGGVLTLWELSPGRARRLWQQACDGPQPHHLAFAADGAFLVALQGARATVWRLNAAAINPQPILCTHNDRVSDALVLAGGRRLVTAGEDGMLCLWAVE